jgi:hypothetical protein
MPVTLDSSGPHTRVLAVISALIVIQTSKVGRTNLAMMRDLLELDRMKRIQLGSGRGLVSSSAVPAFSRWPADAPTRALSRSRPIARRLQRLSWNTTLGLRRALLSEWLPRPCSHEWRYHNDPAS